MFAHNIRPVFDPVSSTWTYIVYDRDTMQAVIIDPVLEHRDRDLTLISEMGLKLSYVMETHIHADHITAASEIREETGAKLVYGAANSHVDTGDLFLEEGQALQLDSVSFKAMATPGHTNGCTSYVLNGAVFTGDALLIRGCGRTDFQEGSSETLFHSVRDKLFSLSDDTVVFPAHDYKGMIFSTIGEEKEHNPRLKLENNEEDFVGIMKNLKLAYPRMIDVAVPANLKSGQINT